MEIQLENRKIEQHTRGILCIRSDYSTELSNGVHFFNEDVLPSLLLRHTYPEILEGEGAGSNTCARQSVAIELSFRLALVQVGIDFDCGKRFF